MKFVFGYRTELFMIFLVPIRAIQWYRFLRYSGTGSSAMMVPIRALRWYRLTDTIRKRLGRKKGYTPKMRILAENKKELMKKRRKGTSCSELARQMGVSRTTMFRFLHHKR